MALTDLKIRRAKPEAKPYKITDANGLYLEVRPTGSKLWRYRYRIAKKENVFALGEYPELSLADARSERDQARALVKQGVHPAHARQAEKQSNIEDSANTFQALAEELSQNKASSWSPKYREQYDRAMAQNVYPRIGKLPIRQITTAQILDILNRMKKRGATTYAISIRKWISQVFRYAVVLGKADADPAAALQGALQRPPINHARPLEPGEISDFLKRLDGYGGNRTTAIALELLLLTFVRTAEIRTAEWTEFDLEQGLWKLPPGKMKKRRTHIVPLSKQAVSLLKELQGITGSNRWLFPNTRRPTDVMSATTVNRALEHMGYPTGQVTGHDFRATASTRLNEMGYAEAHIEMQLAHTKKDKTAASYNHAQYLSQRAEMMQGWADYVYGLQAKPGSVIAFKTA